MFNSRQFQIINLLANKNVSIDKLSKIVKKSVRTVMRDITLINEIFDEMQVGRIVSSKEKSGYELVVKNNLRLEEILKEWVNEEEIILFILLSNKYVTIDELSERLYLSSPVISDKLSNLKEQYKTTIKIEATYHGHYINEDDNIRITLLSNLIEKNPMYFIKEIGLAEKDYNNIKDYLDDNKTKIAKYYKDINIKQFISLALAIYHLFNEGKRSETSCWISELYIENGLICTEDIVSSFEKLIEYNENKKKKITRGTILDILIELEDIYETSIYDMELLKNLVQHLNRSVSYPCILKQNEIYNISNIKALNPFAFDISILFSNMLYERTNISMINNDFIGLYFICAIDRLKKSKYKVLILADQISLAIMNKMMLEYKIINIDIEIVSNNSEFESVFKEGHVGLIINNNSSLNIQGIQIPVVEVNQILSNREIKEISDIIDKMSLKDNIENIFPREFSFTHQVKNGASWQEVIEEVCLRLNKIEAINDKECELIIEREKQDNNLVVNNIAIPHCISTRNDVCVGAYINLSSAVKIEGEEVNNIVVMCVNPKKRINSKIFNYMYRRFNNCKNTQVLKTYDDFLMMMKEDGTNDRF